MVQRSTLALADCDRQRSFSLMGHVSKPSIRSSRKTGFRVSPKTPMTRGPTGPPANRSSRWRQLEIASSSATLRDASWAGTTSARRDLPSTCSRDRSFSWRPPARRPVRSLWRSTARSLRSASSMARAARSSFNKPARSSSETPAEPLREFRSPRWRCAASEATSCSLSCARVSPACGKFYTTRGSPTRPPTCRRTFCARHPPPTTPMRSRSDPKGPTWRCSIRPAERFVACPRTEPRPTRSIRREQTRPLISVRMKRTNSWSRRLRARPFDCGSGRSARPRGQRSPT